MSSLAQRIANVELLIPYGLEKIIALLDIEESRDIPTAAIPIGMGQPKIKINPDFVAQYCQEDVCLAALLLHEMHHLLLGHTRIFPRVTIKHNIAFDAIINAMICRQEPRYGLLFQKTYKTDVFPECLLRPPEGFPDNITYPDAMDASVKNIIQELYHTRTTSFYDVFELICSRSIDISITLLGDHGEDVRGFQQSDDPELFEAIRSIVEQWPQPPNPIMGRSLSDITTQKQGIFKEDDTPDKTIIRAIHKLFHQQNDAQLEGGAITEHTLSQIWPNLRDRRAFAMASASFRPLLYQGSIPQHNTIERCTVYLDVSGSMSSYLEHVSNALLSCAQYITPTIYTFSTKIFEISVEEYRKGSYSTTGGTDITVVAQHIHENNIRSAIILTDGYVGKIPTSYLEACRRANFQVILTENGFRDDLSPVATEIHQLGAP